MDPISTASTFATIVGLVCNFRAERQSKGQDDYNEFLQWIDNARHNDLLSHIRSNQTLAQGINALLRDNHEQVLSKLKALEASMAAVSAHIGGLKEIAAALTSNQGLSDQAFLIIKQLYDSGGSFFIEMKMMGGTQYQVLDASHAIEIQEPRFFADDLSLLCDLGLLMPDFNSRGDRLFRITRAAARVVEANES
ncbi:MAG: hypothetical protein Q7L19_01725 [Pseudohongiella sp.]|nr:hypothetical protein [Pseudohongiella sp.]